MDMQNVHVVRSSVFMKNKLLLCLLMCSCTIFDEYDGEIQTTRDSLELTVIKQSWDDHDKYLVIENTTKATAFVYNYGAVSLIGSLYVPKDARRSGIATTLLDECDTYVQHKPAIIEVDKNAPSWLPKFYESRGYKVYKQ